VETQVNEKLPVGPWIEALIAFLTEHCDEEFRATADGLAAVVGGMVELLDQLPALAFIGVATVLVAVLRRDWKTPLATALGLLFVLNLGYWHETLETLALVTSATLISVTIGVPIGIVAARRPSFYRALRPVLDLMQTIPTFVYLIPTLMLFGLGLAPGLVSTIVFAMPAPIRLTYLGLREVPRSLTEVGDAFGASSLQRLLKVELPHARPAILAGVSQCIMLSLSMVVIAALVGADGLGKPVVQALNTVNVAKGFEAGLVIVVVAVVLDRILTPAAGRRQN
jgi:glycine betaine/proline transport system permease protein